MRVRCTVPRDPVNRWLDYGIDGYATSGRQLDGDQARVTHEYVFTHIPCEAGPAFCSLRDARGHTRRATMSFTILGC